MKILIIKTSSMGDVIHTLPAITDAAKAIPDIEFDWLVEETFAEIPSWHPAITRVIPCAVRRWRKNIIQTFFSDEWSLFRNNLKETPYDLIIDAQGLLKSAFLSTFAQGPIAGLDKHSAREPIASFFYQKKIAVSTRLHAVERIRYLFSQAIDYSLPDTAGEAGLSHQHFSIPSQVPPYVVFLHGTTRADKHWPDEHWISLCKLITDNGLNIKIPWYNEIEKTRAEKISRINPLVEILPKSNLHQLATNLVNAKAFIAVDTGLGHLGAAFGVPGISLYGSTDPEKIGAYGPLQQHIQADSMTAIQPDAVHNKLLLITNQYADL